MSNHSLIIAVPLVIVTGFSISYVQLSSHSARCAPPPNASSLATPTALSSGISKLSETSDTSIDTATPLAVESPTPASVQNIDNRSSPDASTPPAGANTVVDADPSDVPTHSVAGPNATPPPQRPDHMNALKSLVMTNLNH